MVAIFYSYAIQYRHASWADILPPIGTPSFCLKRTDPHLNRLFSIKSHAAYCCICCHVNCLWSIPWVAPIISNFWKILCMEKHTGVLVLLLTAVLHFSISQSRHFNNSFLGINGNISFISISSSLYLSGISNWSWKPLIDFSILDTHSLSCDILGISKQCNLFTNCKINRLRALPIIFHSNLKGCPALL